MKAKHLLFLTLLSGWATIAAGQSFTVVDSLPQGAYGAAAWGDYDNDGWMDLCYIVQAGPTPVDICLVAHNVNNSFVPVTQHFGHLFNPAIKWVDIDNDGFDDLVMNGADSVFQPRTKVYRSLGNGTFVDVPNNIPGVGAGGIDVADYNNDGWMDFAVAGWDSMGNHRAAIAKGTGPWTWTDIQAPLLGIHFGELKWGDYDHDSLADLVINGIGDTDFRTRVYKNMGADSFLLQPFFMQGTGGTVDWADLDNDGWIDILVTGYDSTSVHNITQVHRNNGNGTFTLFPTNLPAFGEPSAVAVADFNNDSLTDICFTGGNALFPWTGSAMAFGTGTSTFNLQPFHPGNVQNCVVEAADMDSDGDIDVYINNKFLRNDGPLETSEPVMDATLYPNPCHGKAALHASVPLTKIRVYDVTGRTLDVEVEKYNNTYRLTFPAGAHGLFFIQYITITGSMGRSTLSVY